MVSAEPERVETVVIGGGQAGLSVGYYLAQRGLPFVILDANERIGDAWRNRWDSLRLFTPRRFDGLAGKPFPGPSDSFPSKDEVGEYLGTFAAEFELQVRSGARVHQLTKNEEGFVVTTGDRRIESQNVVVAMGTHQVPWVPVCLRAWTECRPDALCRLPESLPASGRRRPRRRKNVGDRLLAAAHQLVARLGGRESGRPDVS
jgi:cation diffusion facilitator CzcD-associated flavoprotein CzcO